MNATIFVTSLIDPRLGPRFELEVVVAGVTLVAHLRDDAGLARRRHQQVHLPECLGQRLLHIHVLAVLHRVHRKGEVGMIGRGHDHRVERRAGLVEHLAEVTEQGDGREQVARLLRVRAVEVHIAEGHHAHEAGCGERLDHVVAAVADADDGEAQRPVGRRESGRALPGTGGRHGRSIRHQRQPRTSGERCGQELSA